MNGGTAIANATRPKIMPVMERYVSTVKCMAMPRMAPKLEHRPVRATLNLRGNHSENQRKIHEIAPADMVLGRQHLRRRCVGGPAPSGVVDLILWPQIRAGVAMAVEAELHRQGFGLVAERHLAHLAVTARAAHTLGE